MIRAMSFFGVLFLCLGIQSTMAGSEPFVLDSRKPGNAEVAKLTYKLFPGKRAIAMPAALKNNRYDVRFSGGKLHYSFRVLVPNHCYREGRVSYAKQKSGKSGGDGVIFNVEILHQTGLCAQSVKTLSYSGSVAVGNSRPRHVYVRLLNRFSGTETVEKVF